MIHQRRERREVLKPTMGGAEGMDKPHRCRPVPGEKSRNPAISGEQSYCPKFLLRQEIAVFFWIGGKEKFMLRARQTYTEGLILLGILQGARQDVP